MSRQYWNETLAWATADGVAVASSTTETILFPNITIPANYMQDGRAIRLTAYGKYSTTSTPTMVFALRWGGVAGTLLAKTTTITGGSTITNAIWHAELFIQLRINGSSGSVFVHGNAGMGSGLTTPAVGSATAAPGLSYFSSAASQITPAAVTVDLTADTPLSLTCTWGTNSGSNTITGNHLYLEGLN